MPTDFALPPPDLAADVRDEQRIDLLLATDFDGTVSPIVSDPRAARLDAVVRSILAPAAGDPRIAVAFISGREAADLRARTEGIPAWLAGSHGLECLDPQGRHLWKPRRPFHEPDAALLDRLVKAGLYVERKAFSIAVHFRNAPPGDYRAPLEELVAWARGARLDVVPGRKVVEARLGGGGKRAALRALAGHLRARRVVFAGDDTTDFAALAFAASRGRAVFVESRERAAPDIEPLDRVAGIDALARLFEQEIERVVAGPVADADESPRPAAAW